MPRIGHRPQGRGTSPDAIGIDYLIGEADATGRGLGPEMVRRCTDEIWHRHQDAAAVTTAVHQDNTPSWRALDKAGFTQIWSGVLASYREAGTVSVVYELRRSSDQPGPILGSMNDQQTEKISAGHGFVAALDQSGGSTPKALLAYGVTDEAFSNDEEMFDVIHEMRTRIVTSEAFSGDRIIGAILFEDTMDREIEGRGSAEYLWEAKGVVPFLKVDKGLAQETDGVQLMKPMPGLDELLARARGKGVFGTKMRSVIKLADQTGINAIVGQQFEIGKQILSPGLIPILEPEVEINSLEKGEAEALLKAAILLQLDDLGNDQIMLKLTLPETPDFYAELVDHPKVLKVVALSGGYSREEANARLAQNRGVVASFSRALTEGLTAQQSVKEFEAAIDEAIETIFQASVAG